jgi:hypothetical protein
MQRNIKLNNVKSHGERVKKVPKMCYVLFEWPFSPEKLPTQTVNVKLRKTLSYEKAARKMLAILKVLTGDNKCSLYYVFIIKREFI